MPAQEYFKVTICGPRGVGKTSTLASMYDQISRLSHVNLKTFDTETEVAIAKRLRELRMINEIHMSDTVEGLLQGTADRRVFNFELNYLKFSFVDYPGGWLDDAEGLKKVTQDAKTSQILVVAVDSVYLMEDEECHDVYNNPLGVKRLIENFLPRNEKPDRLIIFSLVKSETYVETYTFNALMNKFEEQYRKCISIAEDYNNAFVIAVPVLTLGCVRLTHLEKDQGTVKQVFVKTGKFSPQYADQVLRYVVRFTIKNRIRDRNLMQWLKDFFNDYDIEMAQHLEVLSKECSISKPIRSWGNVSILF